MAKTSPIPDKGLFATNDTLALFNRLQEVRRLFHSEKVGQAFIDMFNALLEAEIKCSEVSNNLLFMSELDLPGEKRMTAHSLLADISNSILGAIVSVEQFSWAFELTKKGKLNFDRMNEAVAKANSFEELHELLSEIDKNKV